MHNLLGMGNASSNNKAHETKLNCSLKMRKRTTESKALNEELQNGPTVLGAYFNSKQVQLEYRIQNTALNEELLITKLALVANVGHSLEMETSNCGRSLGGLTTCTSTANLY